jgi:hypothetical protein
MSWARTFHGREYFMGAKISWARIFHGREYFMGANISWAQTFHGREYFEMCAYILIGSKYFVCKLLFYVIAMRFDSYFVSLQWKQFFLPYLDPDLN